MKKKLRIRWGKLWMGCPLKIDAMLGETVNIGSIEKCFHGTYTARSWVTHEVKEFYYLKQAKAWVKAEAQKWHERIYR